MTIRFVKDAKPSIENFNEAMEMTPDALKHNGTHLFLRTYHWDSIEVDLTEDIPIGKLRYLHMCSDNIIVNFTEPASDHIARLLCDLYPDKSGTIRKTHMMRGDLHAVLS